MYKIPDEDVRTTTSLNGFVESCPNSFRATCPHCEVPGIAFNISWTTFRNFNNQSVNTHAFGYSNCGYCEEQVFLLYLASQGGGALVQAATYMFPELPVGASFSDHVKTVSPSFVKIYQQAAKAESDGLEEVAGPGYRKALEFLVKDYLISIEVGDQAKKDEIAERGLHRCITDLNNAKLQAAANAAKLTGNDQSHYVNIQGKDLNDLKRFIAITLHWLEIELETEALMASP